MRKFLGSLAILVLLYVGFFGIRINDYEIQPFIRKWLSSNVEKSAEAAEADTPNVGDLINLQKKVGH